MPKETKEIEQPEEEKPKADTEVGTEPGDDEGVDISEEYQQLAHQATHKATKHELNHMRSKINERDDSLRNEEQMAKAKAMKGKKIEGSFDTEGMPVSPEY